MKIECDTIVFKSYPDRWQREKSGDKPNTVRWLTHEESDIVNDIDRITRIVLVNTLTNERFTRIIHDRDFLGEVLGQWLWVFSWQHEEEKQ